MRDIEICLKYPMPTLALLNPKPHKILVDVNKGSYGGLKVIRTRLFDKLFNVYDCDVVLSIAADYRMINRNLINEVSADRVVNYGRFFNTPIIGFVHFMARRLTRSPWSAMFSIPKEIWFNEVRDNPIWHGRDGDIPKCVNMNYESHLGINYMLMRRDTKRLVKGALNNPAFRKRGIARRILKMSQGVKL